MAQLRDAHTRSLHAEPPIFPFRQEQVRDDFVSGDAVCSVEYGLGRGLPRRGAFHYTFSNSKLT